MDENQQAKGHKSPELFRFQTTAPCRYCDAPDLVPVSPAELARIADYVGVTKEEALREYCRHEPLYRYSPRVTLRAGEDGRCPFATERGCALRGVRPRACQLFPLEATPTVIREKGRKERYEMGYHLAQGIPEAGEAYTPESWETRDGTPFREAEALEDFIFRCEVLPLCVAMDQKVAHNSLLRELFRRLYSINLGVLYLNYPDDEPYDTMQALHSPVWTVCVGECSSMAAVILAGGEKGHRYVLANAQVMIHDPLITGDCGGPALSVDAISKRLMRTRRKVGEILSQCTGRSLDAVLSATARDTFFDAQQAKVFGLVDEIIADWGELRHVG